MCAGLDTRLAGEWTKSNFGGIPSNGTPVENERCAKNPQDCFKLNRDLELLTNLFQEDGCCMLNSKFLFLRNNKNRLFYKIKRII